MPRTETTRPTSDARAATTKRARTRRRVLRAALECIAEKGVAGATASEIARRCDLSWGVIQYHFGDRVGLFLALLEAGSENLGEALAGLETATVDPADRVAALVDGTWALMRRDDFRVMLEVQLQLARDSKHRSRIRRHTDRMSSQLREAWCKTLPECDPERVVVAERLATPALRGFALEHAVRGGRATHRAERTVLVEALLPLLGLDGD